MAYYTEKSPSLTEYFSWINNTNEGSTEKQTLINLEFFDWLKRETGAQFDIYAFDAGTVDGAAGTYGSTKSERFKKHYPNGFEKISEKIKTLDMHLGLWGGADGFGDTEESAKERREMIVSLCRDHAFALFKFDTVCGVLRAEYKPCFTDMIEECRKYVPGLVILNHRNDLGGAQKYCTTKLWQSAETYIDVLYNNKKTAPHHRGGTLMRGNPDGLERLVEDHGVCLSSCLDFWADEFIIQAFCRGLILSPQIYGNPWLMREDELRTMGRLISLKRKWREQLVEAKELPEEIYGPNAVVRGTSEMRFITLRNLNWEKKTYTFPADEDAYVRTVHPYEEDLGFRHKGDSISVTLEPWRTALIMLSEKACSDIITKGVPCRPMNRMDAQNYTANIYGMPGRSVEFTLSGDTSRYSKATVDGQDAAALLSGGSFRYTFPGNAVKTAEGLLGSLHADTVPENAETLYEAAVYSADNNALEMRSLMRSGPVSVPEIDNARKAFFEQDTFVYRGIWDRYLFDDRDDTFFFASVLEEDQRIGGGALRVDAGKTVAGDTVSLTVLLDKGEDLNCLYAEAGETLGSMRLLEVISIGKAEPKTINLIPKTVPEMVQIEVKQVTVTYRLNGAARYFRLRGVPARVSDFRVLDNGNAIDRSDWRASNLFAPYSANPCSAFYTGTFHLDTYADDAKICVALEGRHGVDAAYAVLELPDGTLIGAPDKSPSFPANQFEHFIARTGSNNTFYFPMRKEYMEADIKIYVLSLRSGYAGFRADVYLAQGDTLPCKAELTLF